MVKARKALTSMLAVAGGAAAVATPASSHHQSTPSPVYPYAPYPGGLSKDPCAKIAGQDFVQPADALACLKSFPFNETLRQNVIAVSSGVFDFYTFEEYYLNSPPPFQESTVNIRQELARINSTEYAVRLYECLCVVGC